MVLEGWKGWRKGGVAQGGIIEGCCMDGWIDGGPFEAVQAECVAEAEAAGGRYCNWNALHSPAVSVDKKPRSLSHVTNRRRRMEDGHRTDRGAPYRQAIETGERDKQPSRLTVRVSSTRRGGLA